eukprot:PITA_29089
MWKTLTDLYQNNSDQKKLALKDKLRKIKMEKGETIPKYLTKFTQCRDELGTVGITFVEDDMSDLIQVEIKRNTRDGSSPNTNDEDNCALAIKVKKGKGKASHSKSDSYHGGKKKYMTKVKRFHCHELGHFATNCPLKKSKKKSSGGEAELFSDLEEKDLQMHIEMGDDGKYSVTGLGTITFRRVHGAPLTLKNVMYVLGLKKNLISITILGERGYDVIFSKGKAFLRHIAMGQVKKIGFRVKNLYKLEVEECAALSTNAERVQSRDVGKL